MRRLVVGDLARLRRGRQRSCVRWSRKSEEGSAPAMPTMLGVHRFADRASLVRHQGFLHSLTVFTFASTYRFFGCATNENPVMVVLAAKAALVGFRERLEGGEWLTVWI